jgi:hypothetical protein
MSMIVVFTCKWNARYRVLRHRNRFSFVESVRYGLWMARGRRNADVIVKIQERGTRMVSKGGRDERNGAAYRNRTDT